MAWTYLVWLGLLYLVAWPGLDYLDYLDYFLAWTLAWTLVWTLAWTLAWTTFWLGLWLLCFTLFLIAMRLTFAGVSVLGSMTTVFAAFGTWARAETRKSGTVWNGTVHHTIVN